MIREQRRGEPIRDVEHLAAAVNRFLRVRLAWDCQLLDLA